MKSFDERLAMLREELDNTTPEELLAELQSHAPKGGTIMGMGEPMSVTDREVLIERNLELEAQVKVLKQVVAVEFSNTEYYGNQNARSYCNELLRLNNIEVPRLW